MDYDKLCRGLVKIADDNELIDWDIINRETLYAKTYTIVFENINDTGVDTAELIMQLWFTSLDRYAKILHERYEGFARTVYNEIFKELVAFVRDGR